MRSDRRGRDRVTPVGGPTEPQSEIGELHLSPGDRFEVAGPVPRTPPSERLLREVAGMTIAQVAAAATGCHMVPGELTDRLQHRVPRLFRESCCGDQRLAPQRIDHIEQFVLVAAIADDSQRRDEIKPASEPN